MSGCPGTAMPCLQSHVHLVGRNPQVLSCQQSSDLNSQWTQELSTSGINICLTYIQRHRWSGFKTDCFISSGSCLKPGINIRFFFSRNTDYFAPGCLHWLQWSALLWPQGPWNPGPPEFSLWPWDFTEVSDCDLQMFPAIGHKNRVRWMKLPNPWFKTPKKKTQAAIILSIIIMI